MGTIARYLIPINSKLSAPEYAEKARGSSAANASDLEVDDAEKGIFYNGARSTEPFQIEPGDGEHGFELATIFAGHGFTIAPDEYVDGVCCPRCNADITEQWFPQMRDDDCKRVEHEST